MGKFKLATISLLALPLFACAITDEYPLGRAAVDTVFVAAAMTGYGSRIPENCDLLKSPYDREVCLRANSEIEVARVQSGVDSHQGKTEDFDSYKQRRDQ